MKHDSSLKELTKWLKKTRKQLINIYQQIVLLFCILHINFPPTCGYNMELLFTVTQIIVTWADQKKKSYPFM